MLSPRALTTVGSPPNNTHISGSIMQGNSPVLYETQSMSLRARRCKAGPCERREDGAYGPIVLPCNGSPLPEDGGDHSTCAAPSVRPSDLVSRSWDLGAQAPTFVLELVIAPDSDAGELDMFSLTSVS